MFIRKNFTPKLKTITIRSHIQAMVFLMFSIVSMWCSCNEKPAELVILNWSEYFSPEIITAFENKYNARIKEIYFESDDARDEILLQTNGKGFDLILVNGFNIDLYRKRDWIQAIPHEKTPNLKYIDKRWRHAFTSSKNYGAAYFWGTLGIAYRKDLVKHPITSWEQLFKPANELQGKIIMVKSSRDIIGMALRSLGYSSDSENEGELQKAEELLLTQKPHVAKYGYISVEKNSSLVNGEIIAASVYGGDALNVAEHNENIVYVLPEEGGNIWVDYFTISKHSKQVTLAAEFINFINQPELAATNAQELYLATPNSAAKKLLPKEHLEDQVIYPNTTLLNQSSFHKVISPEASRIRAQIFSRVVN